MFMKNIVKSMRRENIVQINHSDRSEVSLKKKGSIRNRLIHFHFKDYVSIFFINVCPCLAKKSNKKRYKLKKLYDIGYKKIKENLDIVKIMRDLSNIKIVMEHSLMNDEITQALRYQNENMIFLDS